MPSRNTVSSSVKPRGCVLAAISTPHGRSGVPITTLALLRAPWATNTAAGVKRRSAARSALITGVADNSV